MSRHARFGYVCCLGRTNVGKSTLLNRLVGGKLGIVSPKPQTTSRRVRGIVNGAAGQLVLIDTPGLHAGAQPVNRSLLREARRALEGADAVLAITDPERDAHPAEEQLLRESVRAAGRPAVLALNKTDLLTAERLAHLLREERAAGTYRTVLGVSARTGRGLGALLEALWPLLPEGEAVFPADQLSDQPEREFFAEMVREQIFRHIHQELPYRAAVVIEEVQERAAPRGYLVRATIYVERESQKGILIGQGGAAVRRIGADARRAMEGLTGAPVFLELWVKVRRNWTRDEKSLREFGFE